jgi:hypothetical protein
LPLLKQGIDSLGGPCRGLQPLTPPDAARHQHPLALLLSSQVSQPALASFIAQVTAEPEGFAGAEAGLGLVQQQFGGSAHQVFPAGMDT